ncbi:GNAT family N-acetyltransferase [Paenarthrobacter nitroguajacolicus]
MPESHEDFRILAGWLSSASPAAALTSDVRERPGPESLRQACEQGANIRLIMSGNGELVGTASWKARGNPRSFEFSLMIAEPSLWDSGVGGRAALRLVDELFMTYDARRVFALTAAYNRHAVPSLVRSGFTLEGVLRDYYFLDGEFHDATVWSMLRDEHRALIANEKNVGMQYQPLVPAEDKEKGRRHVARALQNDSLIPRSWQPIRQPDRIGR